MIPNLRTLVLNNDFSFIDLPYTAIPITDAVIRVCGETCEVIESYDIPIKCVNPYKLIPYNLTCWPSIIVRTGHIIKRQENEPALNLSNLYIRDEGRCAYTGEFIKESDASMDHVIPLSRGGINEWNNVVLSKSIINHEKGNNMPIGKWKPKIIPYTPTYWSLYKLIRKKPLWIDHESWKHFIGPWEGEILIKKYEAARN